MTLAGGCNALLGHDDGIAESGRPSPTGGRGTLVDASVEGGLGGGTAGAQGRGNDDGGPGDGSEIADDDTADGAAGDTGVVDAGVDGGDGGARDGGRPRGPTGLDPDVVLPDPSAPPCDWPGASCGSVRTCRLDSPDGGRCDNCGPQGLCSGLIRTFCSQSLDCDLGLQCFRGRCTLFCSLSLGGPECGKPGLCVNVGHPERGLCDAANMW